MSDDIPQVPDDHDPADAFKRVTPDQVIDPPPKVGKGKKKKDRGGARAPVVETIETPEQVTDLDPMDPSDAADEILNLMEGLYGIAVMIRGYPGKIQLPNGEIMSVPDPAARERTKRALIRLLKTSPMNISPGAGVAIAGFGWLIGPALAIEATRLMEKRGAK